MWTLFIFKKFSVITTGRHCSLRTIPIVTARAIVNGAFVIKGAASVGGPRGVAYRFFLGISWLICSYAGCINLICHKLFPVACTSRSGSGTRGIFISKRVVSAI